MLVLRRLGATTPTTAMMTSVLPGARESQYLQQQAHVIRSNAPGDVQLIPAKPKPTTPTLPSTPVTTPAPSGQPDVSGACNMLWNQLLAQAPDYVKSCITYPTHKRVFDGICSKIAVGQLSFESGAAQWSDYVAKNCPAPQQRQPPTPPPTQNTPSTTPSSSTPTTPGSSTGPSSGPGGDAGGSPDVAEQPWVLRQVGSVVGIGLLVAVGLTYARKKGLLKRLTHRHSKR